MDVEFWHCHLIWCEVRVQRKTTRNKNKTAQGRKNNSDGINVDIQYKCWLSFDDISLQNANKWYEAVSALNKSYNRIEIRFLAWNYLFLVKTTCAIKTGNNMNISIRTSNNMNISIRSDSKIWQINYASAIFAVLYFLPFLLLWKASSIVLTGSR